MTLGQFRLVEPDALYALGVLPLLWLAWAAQRWRRSRDRRASGLDGRGFGLDGRGSGFGARDAAPGRRTTGSGRRLPMGGNGAFLPSTGLRRDITVLALSIAISVALTIAAARPQAIVDVPEYETFDLIIAIDRSASMLATDIQPSRLARACLEVQHFLQRKPPSIDRIALIAFAGTPIVTSHLTRDDEIVGFFLEWMKDDHTPFYGTDLAATLQSTLRVARVEAPERKTVVVLLSDGEDHGETGPAAIDDLRAAGIPVYSIGIGGDEAVTIPAPLGADSPAVLDDDGRPLLARFSEGTLRHVASATNGSYFRSTSGGELSAALTQIAERERKPIAFREEYRDMSIVPLGVAAALLSVLLVVL
ncbi:MAG: VWA domain-containing protein [Vicinamibacterales bacterium]